MHLKEMHSSIDSMIYSYVIQIYEFCTLKPLPTDCVSKYIISFTQ